MNNVTLLPICPGFPNSQEDLYLSQVSILGVIALVAVINNIVALYLMVSQRCTQKRRDTEFWTFICLCITDLLLGMLTMLTCLDSFYGRQRILRSSPGLCLSSIIIVHCLIGISEYTLVTAGVVRCIIILNAGNRHAIMMERKQGLAILSSAIFTITAVIIPEAVTGFRTDDLCIRLVFTCDHSNPKNIRSQCIVVISTALVAIITMVTSYTIILRVIRTSEKWRNSYGMQSNSQTRRNAVLVVWKTIALVAVLIIGWIPTGIYMIDRLLPNVQIFHPSHWGSPVLSPIFLNLISAVNPLCYVLLTKKYLEKFQSCCKRQSMRQVRPHHTRFVDKFKSGSQQNSKTLSKSLSFGVGCSSFAPLNYKNPSSLKESQDPCKTDLKGLTKLDF